METDTPLRHRRALTVIVPATVLVIASAIRVGASLSAVDDGTITSPQHPAYQVGVAAGLGGLLE